MNKLMGLAILSLALSQVPAYANGAANSFQDLQPVDDAMTAVNKYLSAHPEIQRGFKSSAADFERFKNELVNFQRSMTHAVEEPFLEDKNFLAFGRRMQTLDINKLQKQLLLLRVQRESTCDTLAVGAVAQMALAGAWDFFQDDVVNPLTKTKAVQEHEEAIHTKEAHFRTAKAEKIYKGQAPVCKEAVLKEKLVERLIAVKAQSATKAHKSEKSAESGASH